MIWDVQMLDWWKPNHVFDLRAKIKSETTCATHCTKLIIMPVYRKFSLPKDFTQTKQKVILCRDSPYLSTMKSLQGKIIKLGRSAHASAQVRGHEQFGLGL